MKSLHEFFRCRAASAKAALLLIVLVTGMIGFAQMPDPPGQVKPGETPKNEAYLFAHMMDGDYWRLHYSVSLDGLHWPPALMRAGAPNAAHQNDETVKLNRGWPNSVVTDSVCPDRRPNEIRKLVATKVSSRGARLNPQIGASCKTDLWSFPRINDRCIVQSISHPRLS